jgi:hypothetical protein
LCSTVAASATRASTSLADPLSEAGQQHGGALEAFS